MSDPAAVPIPSRAVEAWCQQRYRRPAFDANGQLTVWGVGALDALTSAVDAFAAANLTLTRTP